MGTAGTNTKTEAGMNDSSASTNGSVDDAVATGGPACNWFENCQGMEGLRIGAPLSAGLAQQTGVEQFLRSQPLQQHAVVPRFDPKAPDAVKLSGKTMSNPKTRTPALFAMCEIITILSTG